MQLQCWGLASLRQAVAALGKSEINARTPTSLPPAYLYSELRAICFCILIYTPRPPEAGGGQGIVTGTRVYRYRISPVMDVACGLLLLRG